MSYARELLTQLIEAGKTIRDEATGRTVADAINNQLLVAKSLTPGVLDEPRAVLEALTVYNIMMAYGFTEEQLKEAVRDFAQYGPRKNKKLLRASKDRGK